MNGPRLQSHHSSGWYWVMRVWDQPGLPGKSFYKTKPAKSDGPYTINFRWGYISSEDTVSKEEEEGEGEEEKEEEEEKGEIEVVLKELVRLDRIPLK